MSAPRPDFFIAGVPRGGTTALFRYLSRHPNVFMPKIKEPQYFCSDLKGFGGVTSFVDYTALFDAVPAKCLTGEASSLYLYSNVAIRRLMAHNPQARIVLLLRHPVDAAHSLHASRWGHGHETIESFEDAWHAQADRASGRRLPPHWPDPATLQYGAIYAYAGQIERALDVVPRAQLRVEIYEEFFADPRTHFAGLLDFLGLDAQSAQAFPVVNGALAPRSGALDRALRQPSQALRRAYAPLRPVLHAVGLHPGRALRRLNAGGRPRPALVPEFRDGLERHFAPDIARLEVLLGRSLDVWRR